MSNILQRQHGNKKESMHARSLINIRKLKAKAKSTYIFSCCAKGFSMAYVRIFSLNPLDFLSTHMQSPTF